MKPCLIISLILLSFCSFGQYFEVGSEFGIGKFILNQKMSTEKYLWENNQLNFQTGFSGSFHPKVGLIIINTALLYQRSGDQGPSLNFFKVPIGFDIAPGKKFRVIVFGGGFYVKYLFLVSGSNLYDLSESHSDFQLGLYTNVGASYQFLEKWRIFIKAKAELDLTSLYKEAEPTHSGTNYIMQREYAFGIDLGVKYKIK